MQNDARPNPQDPVERVVFSHPAESAPADHAVAQKATLAVSFSAGADPAQRR